MKALVTQRFGTDVLQLRSARPGAPISRNRSQRRQDRAPVALLTGGAWAIDFDHPYARVPPFGSALLDLVPEGLHRT